MGGWLRLWLVMTTIWVLFVGTMAMIWLSENPTEPQPANIVAQLSDSSAPFYDDLSHDELPNFSVTFSHPNGNTWKFRIPILERAELTAAPQKLSRFLEEQGLDVPHDKVELFVEEVSERNAAAKRAKREYREVAVKLYGNKQTERIRWLSIFALLALVPPALLLIFGRITAWVYDGFRQTT